MSSGFEESQNHADESAGSYTKTLWGKEVLMFKLLRFEDGIEAFEIILNPEGMDVCFLMIPTLISIGHCVEQLLWRRRELPDSPFLLGGQKTV